MFPSTSTATPSPTTGVFQSTNEAIYPSNAPTTTRSGRASETTSSINAQDITANDNHEISVNNMLLFAVLIISLLLLVICIACCVVAYLCGKHRSKLQSELDWSDSRSRGMGINRMTRGMTQMERLDFEEDLKLRRMAIARTISIPDTSPAGSLTTDDSIMAAADKLKLV